MISSFLGLEMGRGALQTTQKGLQTVGHNLENVNTEGFTRQRVTQKTMPALFPISMSKPAIPGQIGTGVAVDVIERIRDVYIDNRIIAESGVSGFWAEKKQMLHQLEMIMKEPGLSNLRTDLEAFWDSWQTVASDPTEVAARIHLLERTKTMNESFRAQHYTLKDLQKQTNSLVEEKINKLNNIAETIAYLNVQIKKQELAGQRPNDLYDKRDMLIDDLSLLADIRLERDNEKEFIVYIGAEKLVQGEFATKVELFSDPQNWGFVKARWEQTQENVDLGPGAITGLIEVRDVDLADMLVRLDEISFSVIDSVNSIHMDGFGLTGETNQAFFESISLSKNVEGAFDASGDGVLDSTGFYRITGNQKISGDTVIASSGRLNFGNVKPFGSDVVVEYNADETVEQVIDRINRSDAQLTAYLDHQGRMTFKSQSTQDKTVPQFMIRHLEDSGNFLVGITGILQEEGLDGAFSWKDLTAITKLQTPRHLISLTPEQNVASWMNLDQAVNNRPESVAVAGGFDHRNGSDLDTVTGFADNRAALDIANLRFNLLMNRKSNTFNDYLQETVAKSGTLSEQAIRSFDKTDAVMSSLKGIRASISAVDVDEEMTKMVALQHAYNASARLVSTTDRLLDVIINQMGI